MGMGKTSLSPSRCLFQILFLRNYLFIFMGIERMEKIKLNNYMGSLSVLVK